MDNFYKDCPAKMTDARFLTDYRSANTREQNIKMINNFVNDDEYRMFLQQNAETVMDKEWGIIKTTNSCRTNTCIHSDPTRSNNGMIYNELKRYNAVRTGKSDQSNSSCPVLNDYRMSYTNGTKF